MGIAKAVWFVVIILGSVILEPPWVGDAPLSSRAAEIIEKEDKDLDEAIYWAVDPLTLQK